MFKIGDKIVYKDMEGEIFEVLNDNFFPVRAKFFVKDTDGSNRIILKSFTQEGESADGGGIKLMVDVEKTTETDLLKKEVISLRHENSVLTSQIQTMIDYLEEALKVGKA